MSCTYIKSVIEKLEERTIKRLGVLERRIDILLDLQNQPKADDSELKPCPFCPEDTNLRMVSEASFRYVFCLVCGSRGTRCKTEEQAEVAWNSRR